ncbi:hypothetical protein [Leucobacter aridicollis]|uniref:hypothetical protein n=1 Tax=Leucobacter aridicollis TaxID=283878 RepID=UPI002106C33A|nr:hypothetical protein [Leucobacter aridicollis]UTX54130.1 hypothetical protein KI794_05315 [Leucobacter aridicollis]
MTPIRIAFAGLAHSHPVTDAGNLARLREHGAPVEFVGVYDSDATLASSFATSFDCEAVRTIAELAGTRPNIVILTARPHETVPFVSELLHTTDAFIFANKVVAGTTAQLAEWESAVAGNEDRVGTSSVLRFAPALRELATQVASREVWGVRVLAQHDIEMFLAPNRAWQDDPERGGGTLVTAGLHAWEMLESVLPGAELIGDVSGWTHRSPGSRSASEEIAQLAGTVAVPDHREVPFGMTVTGTPGPERYAIDVFTATGTLSVSLEFPHPHDSLGFAELAAALLENFQCGSATAPWESARTVATNTLRAAEALRGTHHTEKSH